jgi:hypothetical protein
MRRRVRRRGVARATRLFAVAQIAVAVLVGAAIVHPALASAYNDTYLKVSVTAKNPVSTTTISDQEIASNADLTQQINDNSPASGLSLKGLAALVGVNPPTIQSVTVATPDDDASSSYVVSGTEVMSGFPDDPNPSDSDPAYAWFTPGGDATSLVFTWPGPAPWESDQIWAGANFGAAAGYLDVDFDVSGEVLTVGTPHVSNPVPTAGQAVSFVPPTVSLNGTPETNGLSYTWNFGDGGSSTGPSPSYAYPTAGTWDAWVTVTDANGFQGVSPQVSIQVGKAVGAPGQSAGGTTGGGGGSSPSGGGNGSPNGPSSGASSGASDVPVQSGTPVPRRHPKKATKKTQPKQSRAAGAKTQTGGSGQGSGGSRGAGGSGTGGGSAAGSAGSGGAANAPAGGSKGVTGAGRHGSGGQAGPNDPSLSHAVPPGQVGVLIDSGGGTVTVGGPVTSWLSVVRAAARGSAATGKPVDWQWLIGVFAVVIWVAVGALREVGPRFRRRRLAT